MGRLSALALALCFAAPLGAVIADPPKTSTDGGIGSLPASVNEIVGSVGDCFRFVKHHGQVDHDGFKAAGWQFAGKQDVPGSTAMPANIQVMLGKGNVIMILRLTRLSATCQTVGRIDDAARVGEVRAGIIATQNAKPAAEYKGDDAFKATIARTSPQSLSGLLISDAARFTVFSSDKGDTKIISVIMVPRILD